jgi:hypothetical protein
MNGQNEQAWQPRLIFIIQYNAEKFANFSGMPNLAAWYKSVT